MPAAKNLRKGVCRPKVFLVIIGSFGFADAPEKSNIIALNDNSMRGRKGAPLL